SSRRSLRSLRGRGFAPPAGPPPTRAGPGSCSARVVSGGLSPPPILSFHLQTVVGGITWQLAAAQQAPPRQAPAGMPVVVPELPRQRTEAAQEFMPVQAIWFMRASERRPAAHDDGPVQSSSQLLPMQVTRPWQDIEPEQVTVLVAPTACTPSLHE